MSKYNYRKRASLALMCEMSAVIQRKLLFTRYHK